MVLSGLRLLLELEKGRGVGGYNRSGGVGGYSRSVGVGRYSSTVSSIVNIALLARALECKSVDVRIGGVWTMFMFMYGL